MDPNQDYNLTRVGNAEYIRFGGKRRLVRRYNPGTNQWAYTDLGRRYFSRERSEYIVEVPVRVVGYRVDGSMYEIQNEWMPVLDVNVQAIMDDALDDQEAVENIKASVRGRFAPDRNGNIVVYAFSEQEWILDDSREWRVSQMVTEPGRGRRPDTDVRMHLPLRGGRRWSTANVLHAHLLDPIGFEDPGDGRCVPRGLAKALAMRVDQVEDHLCALFPGWETKGVTAEQVVQLCRDLGRACVVVCGKRVVHRYLPEEASRLKGVAFAVISCPETGEHHLMPYTTLRPFLGPEAPIFCTKRLQCRSRPQAAPEGICEFRFELEPGRYWARDLDAVRGWFLSQKIDPAVSCGGGPHDIVRLRYEIPQRGAMRVYRYPSDWRVIAEWLDRFRRHGLDLEYHGQSLAAAARDVFLGLLRLKRTALSPKKKAELVSLQDGRCAGCGFIAEADERQFDHAVPLSQLCDPSQVRWQMLCASCHAEKTAAEPRSNGEPALSHFSPNVFEHYVRSPRVPQLQLPVHEPPPKTPEVLEIDVRRCRFRGLYFSTHAWPVFGPFDNIEPANNDLGDFVYLTREIAYRGPEVLVRTLPYVGPGWYHRSIAEYLLHHSRITWGDVAYKLTASSHLPPEVFRRPLDLMEEAWRDLDDGPLRAKLSVNAMIGLLSRTESSQWHVRPAGHPEEARGAALVMHNRYGEHLVTDYAWQTQVITNCSYRPVYDMIVWQEVLRVAQLVGQLAAHKVPLRNVVCLKTDAVVIAKTRQSERAVDAICQLRLRDLNAQGLFKLCPLPVVPSDELAFKPGSGARLEGDYKIPVWSEVRRWSRPEVTATEPRSGGFWAVDPTGLLIQGIAGTGKTHEMKKIVARLREEGRRVCVIAKTHAQVQNAEGDCTADRLLWRYLNQGRCPFDVIVVEELSQLGVNLWAELAKAKLLGVSFICLGDFNQFGAICDVWKGVRVAEDALENSDLLRELCPHRITLVENKRSDPPLFEWYASLIPGGSRYELSMCQVLAEARAAFPPEDGHARWNLVISHARRLRINRALNLAEEHPDRVLVASGGKGDGEDWWCFPGLVLIGALKTGRVTKGLMYTVSAVSETHVVLEDGEISLTHHAASHALRLTYAITYASCQGLTLPGRLRLWDTRSPHFSRKHLFVGLSRATAADFVEVV